MARGANQKLKLLYLMKILMENTDESHSMTMQEIISELNLYDVQAERKSIYDDIEELRHYGVDIVVEQHSRSFNYHVVSRQFELAELKLLVDSVQSSKFITAKKSNELIKKIETLASIHEAKQLQRQVYVSNRIKTMNESIYYNVDIIHNAISENVKIKFQYFQWNVDKQPELRHNGSFYIISPWALSWDDENYYMIGYDHHAEKIKHYRVDKMLKLELTVEEREGRVHFLSFDTAEYSKSLFGMFDGTEELVKLECENSLAGVIIDRFGKDITIIKKGENHFTTKVRVAVSRQFLGWIMSIGEGVKIVSPKSVVDKMRDEIEDLNRRYKI